ncbi:hypothetical protein GCM10022293_37220 [Azospirillum formosense]
MVRKLFSGTSFSMMQATVQAWQPTHLPTSTTIAQRCAGSPSRRSDAAPGAAAAAGIVATVAAPMVAAPAPRQKLRLDRSMAGLFAPESFGRDEPRPYSAKGTGALPPRPLGASLHFLG